MRPAYTTPVEEAPSIASQLRYIGRDPVTGAPIRVDDHFIAAVDEDYEQYGKVEREAIPAPPTGPDDLVRLQVPRLAANASVRSFGVDKFGRLDVPSDAQTVAWHPAYSQLPGSGGATFLAAHFAWAGVAGVFNRLSSLQPGDDLGVTLASGAVLTYRVTSVIDYPLTTIDMGAILAGREGLESITLMTCSGPPNEGEYPLRTVVLAVRAEATG